MTDEQLQNNEKERKLPKLVVGAYVINKEGKILIIRSPKWDNLLMVPGGHVEFGERIEQAVIREVKEETNLDIIDIELLAPVDLLDSPEFINNHKHFIALDHKAKLVENGSELILDKREATEYFWFTPQEIIDRNDVETTTKQIVQKYLLKENPDKSEEYKKDWQRALADYKNLQKETSERRSEWAQMSKAQILEDFIPVYDNFKSAFFHHPVLQADNEEHKQMKNWIDGIGYIMKQFGDVMKSHGIEEVKTVGEKFDTNLHESMGEEEVKGKEAGIIIKELVGGYKMGNNVIKAAKVIITK